MLSNDFKILIACEYSGVVRDAFIKRGFNAISCDLLPTESPGPHIQGSVLEILNEGWDMMIAHPPCNYISYAGTQVWNKSGKVFKRLEALHFFAKLWEAPIDKICLENPKSCASPVIAKYTQEIQPYYFGDCQMKTTWLWLKNLPPLEYAIEDELFQKKSASNKPMPLSLDSTGKKRYFSDSKIRDAKERAKFWPGIAQAMAEQWGNYLFARQDAEPQADNCI